MPLSNIIKELKMVYSPAEEKWYVPDRERWYYLNISESFIDFDSMNKFETYLGKQRTAVFSDKAVGSFIVLESEHGPTIVEVTSLKKKLRPFEYRLAVKNDIVRFFEGTE